MQNQITETLHLYFDNVVTTIEGKINSNIYKELKKVLGYRPEDAVFRQKQIFHSQGWHWDGYETTLCRNRHYCKCALPKDGTHFPTGLLSKAVKFLKENNIKIELHDIRKDVSKTMSLEMSSDFEERDYQKEIIDKAVDIGRGIIKIPTGGGKTAIAAKIIKELGVSPFIFYVPSIDLLKQTQDEFQKFLIKDGKNIKVGAIGGGKCDIQDITIMTIQTAVTACGKKYIKYDDESDYNDNEETSEELIQKRKDILELIMGSKGFIVDECVSGDTIIETNKGPSRIDKIPNLGKCKVKSYDGKNIVWKNINNFMPQGKKEILEIVLESGKIIKCTANHPVMTKDGWKMAGSITNIDNVLVCMNEDSAKQKITKQTKIIESYERHHKTEKSLSAKSKNILQNICLTIFEKVLEVRQISKKTLVYDIEVEDTHCFFANDILVHNCQHVSCQSCQDIASYSINAKYRFGQSATPYRDMNDDILIESCFGRTIANINASFLIKKGWLVRPNIFFVPVKTSPAVHSTYAGIYKETIVNNSVRNGYIARIANKLANEGATILILVRHIAHGNILSQLIPNSVFLYSEHSGIERKKHLDKMRNKQAPITLASTIMDEGVDVKVLDTLILAGSGKSQTRALQRIGRTLRPYPGKTSATIIDFEDHYKYMLKHSKKRKSIYETEPEFSIDYLDLSK